MSDEQDVPELWWHPDHSVLMPVVVEGVDYGWYALEPRTWFDARPDGAFRLAATPPAPEGEAELLTGAEVQALGVGAVVRWHRDSSPGGLRMHTPTEGWVPAVSGDGRTQYVLVTPAPAERDQ